MSDNLHIFNDPDGFFTNKTVHLIESIHTGRDIYLNTALHCKNKLKEIEYNDLPSYLKKDLPFNPNKIVFHSYGYLNKNNIRMLKKHFKNADLKFSWVFWSHEYYQLPEFFSLLYQGFSRNYYLRKLITFHLEHFALFFRGRTASPFYMGLRSLRKTFRNFDLMASLIEDDYTFAMKGVKGVKYAFTSYISLKDFPRMDPGLDTDKTGAMIGHSGSPILNHYEIIRQLSATGFAHPVLIPMAYGKKQYITSLQKKVSQEIDNLNITFQTDFIPKDVYYRQIGSIGYFILNSYCQQALGNIFFFLWAGTKVFLRKNTSTYQTLKRQSFFVFSIDDDLTKDQLKPLTPEQKKHNHKLTEAMINEDRVKESWFHILDF